MRGNKKVVWIAVAAALCITVFAGAIVIFAQGVSEDQIIGDIELDEGANPVTAERDMLYRDYETNQEIAQAVCEKYGLDYDTVTRGELDRNMFEYAFSLELLADHGEKPLFGEHKGGFIDSLESSLDEIYADQVAGVILKRICQETGLDPSEAKVSDLSVDQLMEIQEECYQTSMHSKN